MSRKLFTKILIPVAAAAIIGAGGTFLAYGNRITKVETKVENAEGRLGRIEGKLDDIIDLLLERRR